jgi:hypothetical protein
MKSNAILVASLFMALQLCNATTPTLKFYYNLAYEANCGGAALQSVNIGGSCQNIDAMPKLPLLNKAWNAFQGANLNGCQGKSAP